MKPILDYLTPSGHRAVAGLVALSFLDLLVGNLRSEFPHERVLARRPASLAMAPAFRVEGMALRSLPPEAPPPAPAPLRITDLDIPGEASYGSTALPDDAPEASADTGMDYPLPPLRAKPLYVAHRKALLAKVVHPVAVVAPVVVKPAAPAEAAWDTTPFFSMRSPMEAKSSHPRPFFN